MKHPQFIFESNRKSLSILLKQSGKRQITSLFFGFIIALLLSSCGTTKKPISEIEETSANAIITSHIAAMPKFKTMAGRIQVAYETEEKSQSITVSLRMEKDKTIWVKASILGITLAKVLITPDSVSYYETINKTYFEGDFALLGEWLGTPLNFQQAQNLLLGQSIFDLETSKYSSGIFQDKFKILPKRQPQNFIHSLFFYPENFKVALETLAQPEQDRILNIRYGNYQMVEGQFFPNDISIVSSEGQSQTKIEMNYRKIDLNVDIGFPFDIPSGYERIQL
ncbi:DUF4292 domain-containing protein [Aequorivita viscosa]|uniref:Deoxyuridine 5'-triphosphate nucleotidohydrolase n=1 Tax=Aequorivita viscosa TaxID=797419 RepID=A0A1M6H8F1_9FLAO|nr:DUF4292 domain-containing protein [Aequorivita viscosa]SDW89318.1 protein of unknown function [Aequorivita viscosa]SHJ18445.1 protein of unknown function [Aequorivita viscosa]